MVEGAPDASLSTEAYYPPPPALPEDFGFGDFGSRLHDIALEPHWVSVSKEQSIPLGNWRDWVFLLLRHGIGIGTGGMCVSIGIYSFNPGNLRPTCIFPFLQESRKPRRYLVRSTRPQPKLAGIRRCCSTYRTRCLLRTATVPALLDAKI